MNKALKYPKGSYIWEKYYLQFLSDVSYNSATNIIVSSGPKWVTFKKINGYYKYRKSYAAIEATHLAFGDPIDETA